MVNTAGLDWSSVAHLNSYHLPGANGQISAAATEMVRQFRHRMPSHDPIRTCLGVPVLGDPGMRGEIRVNALRP